MSFSPLTSLPPSCGQPSAEQDEVLPALLTSRSRLADGSGKVGGHPGESDRKESHARELASPSVREVQAQSFLPDYDQQIGTGAYGEVYAVQDSPDKVIKVFRTDDWHEVVKESLFAQQMKARDPAHFVDCVGIGVTSDVAGAQRNFAVFERGEGITLESAATDFSSPKGLKCVSEALSVLEQLITIVTEMMKPDSHGNLHFHLDLKPENILISNKQGSQFKVTLIDYGMVTTCKTEDAKMQESALQTFRWLGFVLIWTLSSEHFCLQAPGQNPWEQVPEGFRPFFKRSDFRPPAYQTSKITPDLIRTAMGDSFFSQVMSPRFRVHWNRPDEGKRQLGALLGDLFYGVALASDCDSKWPDFSSIHAHIRKLQELAASTP